MTQRSDFEKAIRAAVAASTTDAAMLDRLALADWLEEQGTPEATAEAATIRRLDQFVAFIQAKVSAYHQTVMDGFQALAHVEGRALLRPPSSQILVSDGPTYWRVFRLEQVGEWQPTRSVYCFIRKVDGAVFKAASWRAPALKPGPRCNLSDDEAAWDRETTMYGMSYRR